MLSNHLTGRAVDLAAIVNGKASWEWKHYEDINFAMQLASKELRIPVQWGGDWNGFKDGVHWELPKAYKT